MIYRLDSTVVITLPVDYDVEPDSSFIDRIAYDSLNARCYVSMHGSTYEYEDVPMEAFQALWSASSVGHEYQDFRSNYGPASYMGKNIEFEVRNLNGMLVDQDAEIPLRDALVTESDEELVTESDELEWSDMVNIRSVALEAAVGVFKGTAAPNSVVLETASEFESFLLGGSVE
jgi:hypothetical protein